MIVNEREAGSVKMAVVEALRKEEREATAERMLYAYHRLKERFRSVKQLMESIEENLVNGVKVREHKHHPYKDDMGKAIYLRLKNTSEEE